MMPVKQRYLHFYFLTELVHVCFVSYISFNVDLALYLPTVLLILPKGFQVIYCWMVFYFCNLVIMLPILALRQQYRPAGQRRQRRQKVTEPRYPVPDAETGWTKGTVKTRDGVELRYRVSKPVGSGSGGGRQEVMLLAAPLGQCGPAIYNPIMSWFGDQYVYVTWDYRGFFESEAPVRVRRQSIPEHAQDGIEVLKAAGFDHADVMVGHSMGTVVCFETVLLYPDMVDSLVIMNGFHGQVFQTAFQPLVRIPFAGDVVYLLIETLLAHKRVLNTIREALLPLVKCAFPIYAALMGSPLLTKIQKASGSQESYLLTFFNSYWGTICSSDRNCEAFLRLFQELNAHSIYHLLPHIEHPVLLISGYLDFLTPAMQTVEVSRRLPHATHYCDPFSTHAAILENPERCLPEIDAFLATDRPNYERQSSTAFVLKQQDKKED